MASDRKGPVPDFVPADETRPVDITGANTRPLPRTPPPPRNPAPPSTSRVSTRERLEAAATRFMDDLPDGVGIPMDDDDDGATAAEVENAPAPSEGREVSGAATIDALLGIPADDDSGMFRIKPGAVERESPVISSAKPPARLDPAGVAAAARAAKEQTRSNKAPPSLASLGMKPAVSAVVPGEVDPVDTQELEIGEIEAEDDSSASPPPVTAKKTMIGIPRVPHPKAPSPPPPAAAPPAKASAPPSTPSPSASTSAEMEIDVDDDEPTQERVASPAKADGFDDAPTRAKPAFDGEDARTRVRDEAPKPAAQAEPPASKRRGAGLWIGLVAAVLVAGGGFGAYQTGLLDGVLGGPADGDQALAAAAPTSNPENEPEPADADEAGPPSEPAAVAASTDDGEPGTDDAEAGTDDGEPGTDETDGGETDGGETDGGETDGGDTDGSDTDGETPEATEETDGGEPEPEPEPEPVAIPTIPAGDPMAAYEAAAKAQEASPNDANLERMAIAACDGDDGKLARQAFRAMGDADGRRRVVDHCGDKTEVNILAKTNGYTAPELLRRAQRSYAAGKYDESLDDLSEAQKIKRQPEAGELRVAIYCAQGDLKKARYMLRRMRPISKDKALAECKAKGVEIEL